MAPSSIISKYFLLTDHQKSQFDRMGEVYVEWNEKINVVSRKDIDNIYINHILHSLGIAKALSFQPGASILDVGTGGGFPGIPLAVLFPETQFHLIDSIGKKITVVREVTKALEVKNIKSEQIRAEQVRGKYDFVISRAVTRMKEFYQWVINRVKEESNHSLDNGILYLKGGDLEEELGELKRPYRLFDLPTYFEEPFFETKKVVHVPF